MNERLREKIRAFASSSAATNEPEDSQETMPSQGNDYPAEPEPEKAWEAPASSEKRGEMKISAADFFKSRNAETEPSAPLPEPEPIMPEEMAEETDHDWNYDIPDSYWEEPEEEDWEEPEEGDWEDPEEEGWEEPEEEGWEEPEKEIREKPAARKTRASRRKAVSVSTARPEPVERPHKGYYGRVSHVEYHPHDGGSRISRWMRSFFTGVPYSSNDMMTTFYIIFEDMEGEMLVEAVGNVGGLLDGLPVEVRGKRNGKGNITAKRIYHVTGDNPSTWSVLRDNRQMSAASVRILTLLLLALAVFVSNVILSFLIPIVHFVEAEWPSLLVYGILIAVGVGWIRNRLRRL